MEISHDAMEQRVWQRVRGGETAQRPDRGLPGLIASELGAAAAYRALSNRLGGQGGETLRRLHREAQAHAACLRGICVLVTGGRPAVKAPPPAQEPVETALCRCCGRAMKTLAEYEARSGAGEYGPVFARLAEQEREHCQALLQLIGNLK